jgi:hypothetical protein
MPCDDLPDDLKTLWKKAGTNQPMFSVDQLRNELERMQVQRRRGHIVMGTCMSFFVAFYALAFFYVHNSLTRIGSTLSVLVCAYWLFHVLAERARVAPDLDQTDGVRFYRTELERTRDRHRGLSWRFVLLALPLVLCDLGFAQVFAKFSPILAPLMWLVAASLLAVLAIWAPLKQFKLARKYQDRIDALDVAAKSSGRKD